MIGKARCRYTHYSVSSFVLMLILTACGGTTNQTLTVTKVGTGGGTITGTGIDCGEDCSESYLTGTSVILTALPDSGSTFVGWSGACTGETCELTIDTTRTVTATFSQGTPAVLIPPTTKVLSKENRDALESYTEGILRFNALGAVPDLSPKNVLVSEPTDAAPYGFMRKVVSTRREGNEILVETVQARLVDAIHSGQFSYEGELTPENSDSVVTTQGGTETQGLSIAVNTDFGSSGIVRATGSVSIAPKLILKGDISCDNWCIGDAPDLYFKAQLILNETANLKIVGNAAYTLNKEVVLKTIRMQPIFFQVGPVPLHFYPKLILYLNTSGKLSASFNYEVKQSVTLSAGAEYESDEGFHDLNYMDSRFEQVGPNYQGDVVAESYLGARFQILLYDAIGPYGELEAGAEAELHVRSRRPDYLLYYLDGCVKVNFGLKIDILTYEKEYEKELAKACKRIVSKSNRPPSVSILSPNTYNPIYKGLPELLESKITDPEKDSVSCKWVSSLASDPFPIEGCETREVTFTTLGSRTLTLVADDGISEKASASVTIKVEEVPEIRVEITNPEDRTVIEASEDEDTVIQLTSEVISGAPESFLWTLYYPVDSQGRETAETRLQWFGLGKNKELSVRDWIAYDCYDNPQHVLFKLSARRSDTDWIRQDQVLVSIYKPWCEVE